MDKLTIVGAGRVGGAMALAFSNAGIEVEEVVYRSENQIGLLRLKLPESVRFSSIATYSTLKPQVAIIAVGDPDIRTTADELGRRGIYPGVALHTSGSLASVELAGLAVNGTAVGSMHPLVAISDIVTGSEKLHGTFFCVEGGPIAVDKANTLIQVLGGRPFSIPTAAKALYHGAAVMAAGHVVALIDAAAEAMSLCGLDIEKSREILGPLIESTTSNLRGSSTAAALTGPFARGDAEAFARNLAAIESTRISTLRDIYIDLALRSTEIMIRDGKPFQALRQCILMAKENSQ